MPDSSSCAGIAIKNFELGSSGASSRRVAKIAASEVASRNKK